MANSTYGRSYTTAALLHRESIVVASLYAELADWNAVRDRVLAGNLLQMRTPSTAERICGEVIARLKLLTPAELTVFTDGSRQEQGYLLWLAVCKRNRFVHDFAVEVMREKYLRLNFALTNDDYDVFFHAKSSWHPELDRLAPKTRTKQRQFLFRTLREADLLSTNHCVMPAMFTPRLIEAIAQDDAADFTIFPIAEING